MLGKGDELMVTPRYLKAATWSRVMVGRSWLPVKLVFPVTESWDIILDLSVDNSRWCVEKKSLVMDINLFMAARVLPISTMSSAKKRVAMLMLLRGIPRLVWLSSGPRAFIKMENNSGLRLQPTSKIVRMGRVLNGILCKPCFTPCVSHRGSVNWPLSKKVMLSLWYNDFIIDNVLPPNPIAFSFSYNASRHTESYA